MQRELGTARNHERLRRRRRGRSIALVVLVVSALLVGYDFARRPDTPSAPAGTGAVPNDAVPNGAVPNDPAQGLVRSAAGTFSISGVGGEVAGRAGPVQTYQVAVEDGLGIAVDEFGTTVDTILSDPRGWTAGGTMRLQRVGASEAATFTVFLASPVTSEQMCREGGMETDQYTNCRLADGRVVINSDRWLSAVPGYGAPLALYRAYAVNHEVGHQLGHGHELCPAPGAPAPVMQQQTLGLEECVANGWPYVNGVRYEGPATNT